MNSLLSRRAQTVSVSDHEIVSSRWVRSERPTVWDHFADPAKLVLWWGPKGFTNTFEAHEFRPGGLWRLAMHGPDGTTYRMEKRFVEVSMPERIVHDHLDPAHSFRMTIILSAEDDGTRITWRMRFDSAEEFARVKDFIAQANEENLDRLEAELARSPGPIIP